MNGSPTPRMPGWHYVTTTKGVRGWHLVDRTNPEYGVVTVCGISGRVIDVDATTITPCTACAAPQASS